MKRFVDIEKLMQSCTICPRECAVNRIKEAGGVCRAGSIMEVRAAHLHFGEEPPISGRNGSGTIFFNHCNLRCVYCQNYQFSQADHGKEFDIDTFADLMLSLERKGAHNINLVTPTHYAAQVINAVMAARSKGLTVPIVYNTGGYDKAQTLRMLDGLIDIYLVDMRYGDDRAAAKYSSCPGYVQVNRAAVTEMQRQVGVLRTSKEGIAEKGVIIRHLVLPNELNGTESIFKFIAEELGENTYISFMSQYYPAYKAGNYVEIARGLDKGEYDKALSLLDRYGLRQGWIQQYMGGVVDSDFAGTDIRPNV